MSTQLIEDRRQKLIEFVVNLGPKATQKEIRAAAYKQGLGPIAARVLADIRRAAWPDRKSTKGSGKVLSRKFKIVDVAENSLCLCPHCSCEKSKVGTAYWQDDGTVLRVRMCLGCSDRYMSLEPDDGKKKYDKRRSAAINATERQCADCGLLLPIDCFGRKDAIYCRSYCRECANKRRAVISLSDKLKEFGLTIDRYNELLQNQNGGCAICGETNIGKKHSDGINRNPLVFDHCHKTGKFRGLICHRCNRALGLFGDNFRNLELAADYLRRNSD